MRKSIGIALIALILGLQGFAFTHRAFLIGGPRSWERHGISQPVDHGRTGPAGGHAWSR